jgi:hypothetical protein
MPADTLFPSDDGRRDPSFSSTSTARRRPAPAGRRSFGAPALIALGIAAVLAAAGWFVYDSWRLSGALRIPAEDPATAPQPQASVPEQPPELLPAEPATLLSARDITSALMQLLGREAVLRHVVTTDFPRMAVATLDNLGRDHAPVVAWPVVPASGRFATTSSGTAQVIAPDNAARYRPLVSWFGSIDAAQAVDLYRRMYPVLQREYRELGFGDRQLHARLLEVIDLLLATPEPQQPLQVTLTEVKGPVPSMRPWTRYEFADPALQRLTSGQKMLLRVGPDNRKVLKAKLEDIRRQLLAVSVPSKS